MSDMTFKTEVVINTNFGAFSLSNAAIIAIKERKKLFGLADSDFIHDLKRNDPILVGVVKDLGDAAAGKGCALKIVEVDLTIEIRNYDGKESVHVGGDEFI